ncbi:hypothetical protein [Lacticaseibacillus paracasei]
MEELDKLDNIMMNLDRYKTPDSFQTAVLHSGQIMQKLNLLNQEQSKDLQKIIDTYSDYLKKRLDKEIRSHPKAE